MRVRCLARYVYAGTGTLLALSDSDHTCALLRMTLARILTLFSLESRHASQNRLQGIEIDVDAGVKSVRERENRQLEGVTCISSSAWTSYVSVISSL